MKNLNFCAGQGPAAGPYAQGWGPLRVWPGGLCLSRALGDFDVGCIVLAIPHIMQVRRWPWPTFMLIESLLPAFGGKSSLLTICMNAALIKRITVVSARHSRANNVMNTMSPGLSSHLCFRSCGLSVPSCTAKEGY